MCASACAARSTALPASGTFKFGAKGGISSTDVTLPGIAQLDATYSGPFSLLGDPAPIQYDYNPAPTDGMQYIGGTEYDSDSGIITSTLALADYIGTGTYDIDVDIIQWSEYGSVGGIEYAVTPVTADGTVTVIYEYIPEPATITMLALGALGFLKRKSSK